MRLDTRVLKIKFDFVVCNVYIKKGYVAIYDDITSNVHFYSIIFYNINNTL